MAWIGGAAGVNRLEGGICSLWSSIGVAVQTGSEIVPTWRAAFAEAPENVTVPKFARCSTRQSPALHDEGASAIHSADERSGVAILSFLEKYLPLVRFRIVTVTLLPMTVTVAEIVSPGRIVRFTSTGPAGTSSYHAA